MLQKNVGIVITVIFALAPFVYGCSSVDEISYDSMSSRDLAQLCLPDEGTAFHIHQRLTIVANKQVIQIPSELGVENKKGCIKPLHTHDLGNVIHVESPVKKDFILGDFFAVWGKTFNKNQILDYGVDADHSLKVYINGKETEDFENIILADGQNIFIDYYATKDGPDVVPAYLPLN